MRPDDPETDKRLEGLVVPIPTFPAFEIVSAAGVEVPYASVEVPTYKFPPIDEKSQCFKLAAAEVSESANEGRVPATCKSQFGVVVPIPRLPALVISILIPKPVAVLRVRNPILPASFTLTPIFKSLVESP